MTLRGPEPQPLHHARPEALHQPVRPLREIEEQRHPLGPLEVDRDGAPPARQHVELRVHQRDLGARRERMDADHLGARIREHHRREGAGAEAHHLDDPQPRQRSGRGFSGSLRPALGEAHAMPLRISIFWMSEVPS